MGQIKGFQIAYNAFEKRWFTFLESSGVEIINFKRRRIRELDLSNSSGLELMLYVVLYRTYIAKSFPSSILMYFDSIGIRRSRIKEKISLMDKIYKNIVYDQNKTSYIYITRCINDIFGARVIVDQIADAEGLINDIAKEFPNLRVTDATKATGYKAIHIYTNPTKGSLPWELQIWQACDEENNTNLHAVYKRGYINGIKAVKEVNN